MDGEGNTKQGTGGIQKPLCISSHCRVTNQPAPARVTIGTPPFPIRGTGTGGDGRSSEGREGLREGSGGGGVGRFGVGCKRVMEILLRH